MAKAEEEKTENITEQEIDKNISDQKETEEAKTSKKKIDPVILTTRIVLLFAAIVFIWYILSDRFTPYTSLARITETTIPITPRVSGNLIEVNIKLHSIVKPGELLFQIDTTQYYIAVKKAEANLENVIQQLGAQGAAVKSAASSVGVAKAQLDRAQRNYNRTQRIIKKNPGALSQYDIDKVETSLNQAVEKLASAEANLQKAKKQLGIIGKENPQLKMAITDLNNAQMQLQWTKIYAPSKGYIESFNLDIGYYCQAGKPLATLVTKENLWIQANLKENNISKMKIGNKVEFVMDIAPGKIFEGKVQSISYGIDAGNKAKPGDLPKVNQANSWLQDPQRFPVIISFTDTTAISLSRNGGQADVVIYTGKHGILNAIAKLRLRINSWLSYVR
jgi:multidrug resistance efflux pump